MNRKTYFKLRTEMDKRYQFGTWFVLGTSGLIIIGLTIILFS